MLELITLHVTIFYLALIQIVQTVPRVAPPPPTHTDPQPSSLQVRRTLAAMCRLLRGTKQNMLRAGRVDSYRYNIPTGL